MSRVHFWSFLKDEQGRPIPDANLKLYLTNTLTEATIYATRAASATDVLDQSTWSTNTSGYFEFYIGDAFEVAPNVGFDHDTLFDLVWSASAHDPAAVGIIDNFQPLWQVFPVDETLQGTTRNKMISNQVAFKFDDHEATTYITEPHNVVEVNELDPSNSTKNKIVSNKMFFDLLADLDTLLLCGGETIAVAASYGPELIENGDMESGFTGSPLRPDGWVISAGDVDITLTSQDTTDFDTDLASFALSAYEVSAGAGTNKFVVDVLDHRLRTKIKIPTTIPITQVGEILTEDFDYTDFTEIDPGSKFEVASDSISATPSLLAADTPYIYTDLHPSAGGPGLVIPTDGFHYDVRVKWDDDSRWSTSFFPFFCLGNEIGNWRDNNSTTPTNNLNFVLNTAQNPQFQERYNGGASDQSSSMSFALNANEIYRIVIKAEPSDGRIILKAFDESETEVQTTQVNLNEPGNSFRYLYAIQAYRVGTGWKQHASVEGLSETTSGSRQIGPRQGKLKINIHDGDGSLLQSEILTSASGFDNWAEYDVNFLPNVSGARAKIEFLQQGTDAVYWKLDETSVKSEFLPILISSINKETTDFAVSGNGTFSVDVDHNLRRPVKYPIIQIWDRDKAEQIRPAQIQDIDKQNVRIWLAEPRNIAVTTSGKVSG